MTTPMVDEFKEDKDIFNGMKFTNSTEETKKVIQELDGKVDVMLGLMHMGMDNENNHPDTGVADLANACPELAVIFAGHMHKLHEEDMVNNVLIAEPSKYATYLSRVDLTFVKEGNQLVLKSKKDISYNYQYAGGEVTVYGIAEDTRGFSHERFKR